MKKTCITYYIIMILDFTSANKATQTHTKKYTLLMVYDPKEKGLSLINIEIKNILCNINCKS